MKKLLIALGLALAACGANAASYYLSDCFASTPAPAAGCTIGSDTTGTGTSTNPWQTIAKLPTINPGDTVYFAKGGAFSFSGLWYPHFGTQASPTTYTSYQATWCSSGACLTQRPILYSSANTSLLALSNAGVSVPKAGITIDGLALVADPTSNNLYTYAVFIYNDSKWITINNVELTNYGEGIVIQGNAGIGPGSDGTNRYIKITNSNIHDNLNQGLQGFATDMLIENNSFTFNGKGAGCSNRCHNLYIGGTGTTPDLATLRVMVRGNYFHGAGYGGGSTCLGVEMNMHGTGSYVTFEDNTIDDTGDATGGCYGISAVSADPGVAEGMSYVTIRGNHIINVAGNGIGMSSCFVGCVIENNVIVITNGISTIGIQLPGSLEESIDRKNNAVTVRNNSIYFGGSTSASKGITFDTDGTSNVAVSNLVYYDSSAASGHLCYQPGPLSMFTVWDNNLCFDASAFYKYSATYSTLALAQAAGFDVHGLQSDPLLVATPASGNGYSLALQTGSPAINAANTTYSSRLAYQGRVPSGVRDIGAYDFGSGAPVTSSPVFIKGP